MFKICTWTCHLDKKMCNLGKRICYLQLQIAMLNCFLKHKGLNFQFDSSNHFFFFFSKSGFIIFSLWKWARTILVDMWMVREALNNISECIQKLLEMQKIWMLIKALNCGTPVCCNPPLQPNNPVPQWIILKYILERRCNGQNRGITEFPECLWLFHRSHLIFSNTLVFLDLLIAA